MHAAGLSKSGFRERAEGPVTLGWVPWRESTLQTGDSGLNRVCSIFSQLLQLFPRLEFEQAVRETRAEHHAREFTRWGQFVAMLFCQLGQARSLREICGGLAGCEDKRGDCIVSKYGWKNVSGSWCC
jgi:hypothetical protein